MKINQELFSLVETNREFLKIPTKYIKDDYFPDWISKKLNDYYDFLKSNNVGKLINQIPWDGDPQIQFLNRVRAFKDAINNSIELYYTGKVGRAHERFNNSLEKIVAFKQNTVLTNLEPQSQFYRIRYSTTEDINKRDQNFHIKFNLRHICSTQRYSIPGVPSIYLGDSAFIAYNEVGQTDNSAIYISKFVNTFPLQIIAIQTVDDFISQYQSESREDYKLTHILRFLLLYPLYLACTVKVLNTTGSFKTEYIVPQLLMQYVGEDERIKGIKFPSTKIDSNNKYKDKETYNYVFAVQCNKKDGFCDFLSSVFELTIPKSFEQILKGKSFTSSLDKYDQSTFYYIEQQLEKEFLDNVLN